MVDRAAVKLPVTRACPFAVPPEYARLRRSQPVARAELPNGRHVWLVTGPNCARAVLADTRFSSDRANPAFPTTLSTSGSSPRPANRNRTLSLISMDSPEHGLSRRPVIGEFTARRMRELRPRIQRIVDQHIDAMLAAGPPTDLVTALSLPVPSEVICELLGVPYSDHEFFQSRSALMLSRGALAQERYDAARELRGYLSALVTAKEDSPGHLDLLDRQISQLRTSGRYDRDALVNLAFLLLLAGHETTASMISLGTLAIIQHPALLRPVLADPDQAGPAVEELLRYFSVADIVTARVATSDIEVGQAIIPSGDPVIVSLLAVDRDPAIFAEPDSLDPHRQARTHLAFGYGPHQCIGQNLARVELEIVYRALFRRIPGLRLAVPADQVTGKDDALIYGLRQLPVMW
jgi:cytochrome P450